MPKIKRLQKIMLAYFVFDVPYYSYDNHVVADIDSEWLTVPAEAVDQSKGLAGANDFHGRIPKIFNNWQVRSHPNMSISNGLWLLYPW